MMKRIWKMALIGSIVAMTMGGLVSSALAGDKSFSPFERVATLDAVYTADGELDELATYKKGKAVAYAIASYIDQNNEAKTLGFPSNWILAGADKDPATDDVAAAILSIPSKLKIDSTLPKSPANTRKIAVVEICNKDYASKALGVADITEGQPIPNGHIHASALPCEISVHNEGDKIYVNMLNAQAIFTLFFTDVLTSSQMDDPDFAEQMMQLPGDVKSEMRAMILEALADKPDLVETSEMVGPIYRNLGKAISAVAHTQNQSPYVHFSYVKADGSVFTKTDVQNIALQVMDTMSIHGEADAGTHDPALEGLLSNGSSWRSARHEALAMPGGNFVVEACSPTYAKLAISSTRLDHAAALPCEIAFKAINGGTELLVSYLDPNFMFDIMFADMTDIEKESLGALPGVVLNDLQNIVNYSFENDLDIFLSSGMQVEYDMLQD